MSDYLSEEVIKQPPRSTTIQNDMPTSSSAAYGAYKPTPVVLKNNSVVPREVSVDMNNVPQITSSSNSPPTGGAFCESTLCKLLTSFLIACLVGAVIALVVLLMRAQDNNIRTTSTTVSGGLLATGTNTMTGGSAGTSVSGSITSGPGPIINSSSGITTILSTTITSSNSSALLVLNSSMTTTPTVSTTSTFCSLWNPNPIIVAGNASAGSSASLLNGPWDFSIDANFNIYVSDGGNNRIQKYSNGSLIGITLTSGVGTGASQVSNPSASYVDMYGNLYVSDMFNHRVMQYTNISLQSATPPIIGQVVAGGSFSQIQISWGVVVDPQGNVFVSDYGNNCVTKWPPGSSTRILVAGSGNNTFGSGPSDLYHPQGIYIDQNLTLYIADSSNNRIQQWFSGSSTGITVAGGNGQIFYPTDVSVDTYGIVYVLTTGGIYQFYPGSTSGTLIVPLSGYGYGFKFDSIGNLYYANYGGNIVVKYLYIGNTCGNSTTTNSVASSTSASITNSSSLSLYGVIMNLSSTTLPTSWSQCYSGVYATYLNRSVLTSILNTCNKTNLLLACRPVGSTVFTVAAMGNRYDVLYNCSTSPNCSNVANGVGWYYSDIWSWGFASSNDTIYRSPCDTYMNTNTRLCWHTTMAVGGYRCGNKIGLNIDVTTERVIYHSY